MKENTIRIEWPPMPKIEPITITLVRFDVDRTNEAEAAREARRLATIQDNEAL